MSVMASQVAQVGKESACQCRRHRYHSWAGRCPGEGNDNPLQYSCLENFMGRGVWQATVCEVTKSRTWLSRHTRMPCAEGRKWAKWVEYDKTPLDMNASPIPYCCYCCHFSRVRLCAAHRRQPTRLPHPRDSPGKNTGVGCHFLLQCMKVKNESEVVQSGPTLSNPMDCSLPGSSVHGIFQARVLECSLSLTTLSQIHYWQFLCNNLLIYKNERIPISQTGS